MIKLKVNVKVALLCLTLCNPTDCGPWNAPGQNTGVGSLSLFQGIFPAQGLNQVYWVKARQEDSTRQLTGYFDFD